MSANWMQYRTHPALVTASESFDACWAFILSLQPPEWAIKELHEKLLSVSHSSQCAGYQRAKHEPGFVPHDRMLSPGTDPLSLAHQFMASASHLRDVAADVDDAYDTQCFYGNAAQMVYLAALQLQGVGIPKPATAPVRTSQKQLPRQPRPARRRAAAR